MSELKGETALRRGAQKIVSENKFLSRNGSLPKPQFMRQDRRSLILFFASAWICLILLSACAEKEKHLVDIPEGIATDTLKEFARQADVEILFDRQSVYGVRTNPVKGRYDPASALNVMLKDTPLGVNLERESGAYAVFRKDY